METFCKWQDEVIVGFNEKLAVGWRFKSFTRFWKKFVNICFIVRLIDDQGEVIGRLHQTIQNSTKGINITSTIMSDMEQDLQNIGK